MSCYFGDARVVMRRLIGEGVRVQMCVTSPPYWGLRDYGTARWEGGDAECDHRTRDAVRDKTSTLAGTSNKEGFALNHYRGVCGVCGALRVDGQLGLEPTPEEYVRNMVEVFGLVRELLADDGVLFLNLGDSYAGGGGHSPDAPSSATSKSGLYGDALKKGGIKPQGTIKVKDLVGIPWAVAFALRADGWYLRQDIIWSKPNPMPESVTDRCTKSHEYLFLLSKRERYYYDAAAIAEPSVDAESLNGRNPRRGDKFTESDPDGMARTRKGFSAIEPGKKYETRNKRSVWVIPTRPNSQGHFAMFPEALIEPCILAGSRPGDTVLDPFLGSGTVGEVCNNLGRKWLGIELNEAYRPLQDQRTAQQGLVLA